MGEPLLCARGLTCRFGGVLAVDDVSIDLRPGEIHAVIGTNGAGKSTLVNLLSGELLPTSGEVSLSGRALTGAPPHRLASLGIGRTFQRSNVFQDFTAFENCRLAAQARNARPWALHEKAVLCPTSGQAAGRALQAVGLSERGGVLAGLLSHGERRVLEIAMCLSGEPKVLLLDEPLAGMGAEESGRVLTLLQELKRERAILLVEHDMDAVFAVADLITVMADGAVLATGLPDAVRTDPAVRKAYLGDAT